MPTILTPREVLPYLRTETKRALQAAKRIPVEAAADAFEFLLEAAPVYSGAYRASFTVGISGNLPEIPSEIIDITDPERHERARSGNILEHPDPGMARALLDGYELDDDIEIANEIRYAGIVEEKYNYLVTVQALQVAEESIQRGIQRFNARSLAASRGRRGRR